MKTLKIFLLLFTLSAGIYFVSMKAMGNRIIATSDNDSLEVFFKKIPAPIGMVNDFENVFSLKQISEIDSLIKLVNKSKDVVIVVLSLDSSMANKNLFDSVALKTAKQWGIGDNNKNNGILIAFSKSLRRIRIQNGFGIEARLSDEETSTLINQVILPEFKVGNYSQGITKGIQEIERKLK
jgi:uncharacterized protein